MKPLACVSFAVLCACGGRTNVGGIEELGDAATQSDATPASRGDGSCTFVLRSKAGDESIIATGEAFPPVSEVPSLPVLCVLGSHWNLSLGVALQSQRVTALLDDSNAHDATAFFGACQGKVLIDGQPPTDKPSPKAGSTVVADFTCRDLVVNAVHYEIARGHLSTTVRTPK